MVVWVAIRRRISGDDGFFEDGDITRAKQFIIGDNDDDDDLSSMAVDHRWVQLSKKFLNRQSVIALFILSKQPAL
jgi:hypothetical protein